MNQLEKLQGNQMPPLAPVILQVPCRRSKDTESLRALLLGEQTSFQCHGRTLREGSRCGEQDLVLAEVTLDISRVFSSWPTPTLLCPVPVRNQLLFKEACLCKRRFWNRHAVADVPCNRAVTVVADARVHMRQEKDS